MTTIIPKTTSRLFPASLNRAATIPGTAAPGPVLLLLFFFLFVSPPAEALDVTTLFHMGNLGFDSESEKPVKDYDSTAYSYGISAYGNHQIDESLSIEAGLYDDSVLRRTIHTRFLYSHEFFRVGVGPFLGIFNTKGSVLKSGLSSSLRVEYPGKVFGSVRSDSTIAARFTKNGDYLQERNSVTLGYYVPNAICSLNLNTKRFITQKTKDLEVDDDLTEYSFDVDIYQKNIPIRLLLSFAFQQRERVYNSDASTDKNTLNSLILGTRLKYEGFSTLTLVADIDHSIYSFGKYVESGSTSSLSMTDSGIGSYLFDAKIGVIWHF
ncbi:MAG: hypothetical protein R6V67_05775 [Spirochaetia bacterium]